MLIVDTGVVLAASDNGDPDHAACAGLLQDSVGQLVTTASVIAESAYLIGRQLGVAAEARFFRSIADGEITVEALIPADDLRIARIATLDHRHFTVVRPAHCDAFELVP